MEVWFYLGLIMIGMAILISTYSFLRYARKKMSDSFVMIWFLISLVVFILGIALILAGNKFNLIVTVVATACALLLLLIFIVSSMVSELMMKVRELAMQVALLNQENDSMLHQINELKEQEKDV